MRLLAALIGVGLVVLSACGGETSIDEMPSVEDRTSAADPVDTPSVADEQRYTATALVLESPDHGPQLCLGGVLTSYPPQCGGPNITNWDWSDVEFESASGTTWGTYTVVGTYDGTAFTLTEPAQPPASLPDRDTETEPPASSTPCEEPEGGWAVVDEATATEEAMNAAIAYANAQTELAGIWLDQSINEALADASDDEIEGLANDPTKLVLNISFTGNIEHHEAELREIWGGALCVSQAERTMADLRSIQREVMQEYDGVLSAGVDTKGGRVTLYVIVDDGSLQAELDERYGEGVVVVTSALRPVE